MNKIFKILLLVFSVNVHALSLRDPGSLKIKTNNGYVMGRGDLNGDKSMNAWLGIPYAEKPINELRFARPVPVKNWNNVLDATQYVHSCYQINPSPNYKINEDCLYLNIAVPANKSDLAAVLIYIHGGGFVTGSSFGIPSQMAKTGNIIIVTVEYRLDIFGFLYIDTENAPGNQGLLDQYMAIKWVYDNIGYFGGDNTRISIMGQSAGAWSVSYHLLSNLTGAYFRNAIMDSGSALYPGTFTEKIEAIRRSTKILEYFGCNDTRPWYLVDCAKKIDPKRILEMTYQYWYNESKNTHLTIPFSPVVDGYYLLDEPLNILKAGKFKKCSILAGVNKDEGNSWLRGFPEYQTQTFPQINYDTFKSILTSYFYYYPIYPTISTSQIQTALIYRYTNWSSVDQFDYKSNFDNLDYAVGDFIFLCPCVQLVDFYSLNGQDAFQYYFTHVPSTQTSQTWLGSLHTAELPFAFGTPLYDSRYTSAERDLSLKMVTFWTNFVKYNDPNGIMTDFVWPKHTNANRNYIILEVGDHFETSSSLRAEYCAFWSYYLPNLNGNNTIIPK